MSDDTTVNPISTSPPLTCDADPGVRGRWCCTAAGNSTAAGTSIDDVKGICEGNSMALDELLTKNSNSAAKPAAEKRRRRRRRMRRGRRRRWRRRGRRRRGRWRRGTWTQSQLYPTRHFPTRAPCPEPPRTRPRTRAPLGMRHSAPSAPRRRVLERVAHLNDVDR